MYVMYSVSRLLLMSMTTVGEYNSLEDCLEVKQQLVIQDKTHDYMCFPKGEKDAISFHDVRNGQR
jgi:hypothetical protein